MSNNEGTAYIQSMLFWVIVATALGILFFAWTLRRGGAAAMANQCERSIGLAIPDELRSLIGRRLVRRRRSSLTGSILGLWAGVPLALALGLSDAADIAPFVLLQLGASLVGGAIGTALGSFKWPLQRAKESIRYARPRAVRLDDYIPPFERRGAWVAVVCATIVVLTSVIMVAMGIISTSFLPSAPVGIILAVIAVASLGFFESVGRRITGRTQPTGSEPELVWDDAMRSLDVRDLAYLPMGLGLYVVLLWGMDIGNELRSFANSDSAQTAYGFGGVLLIIAMVAIGVYAVASLPQRYFLRRLWPQYVDAGTPQLAEPNADPTGSKT